MFGEGGSGRVKLEHAGMVLELVGRDRIDPRQDSCIAAFVYIQLLCKKVTKE